MVLKLFTTFIVVAAILASPKHRDFTWSYRSSIYGVHWIRPMEYASPVPCQLCRLVGSSMWHFKSVSFSFDINIQSKVYTWFLSVLVLCSYMILTRLPWTQKQGLSKLENLLRLVLTTVTLHVIKTYGRSKWGEDYVFWLRLTNNNDVT